MVKKLILSLFALAVLFGTPLLGYAEECKVYKADVFFGIVSAEKETVEIDMQIGYCQYGPEESHDLSVDGAGDKALGTVSLVYAKVGKWFPSATLRSKEGVELLKKEAWTIVKRFNDFPDDPVEVVEINITKMTFSPDPESVGRPVMFYINEESGDAKAGI